MTREVFVPRLMDQANRNPQNNNARMLLGRWRNSDLQVRSICYDAPDPQVVAQRSVNVVRLWSGRAWTVHLFLQYLQPCDAVFYPGVTYSDVAGLRIRRALRGSVPVIATLEGLVGDAGRERFYSSIAGHPVYCQRVAHRQLRRCDRILEMADHVIAISPFLARLGRARYGDKFSVLPIGLDLTTFRPRQGREDGTEGPLRVVCAGRVAQHKRPEVFLRLAATYKDVRFSWYGDGEQRSDLVTRAAAGGLSNLEFPGPLDPQSLADAFRRADVFVLPSLSEGVPKVTLEAASCGLPVIVFGHYETPSVQHEANGFVVWSDEELINRLDQLLGDQHLRRRMGGNGAEMMQALGWDKLAPMWEGVLREKIGMGGDPNAAVGSVTRCAAP